MKKQIFLLPAVLLVLASCSDFLDRMPYSAIPTADFYKTEKELDLAGIGLYGSLQTFYQAEYPQLAELCSDNTSCGNGENAADGEFDNFSLNSMNSKLENAWNRSYNAILQTNKVLASLPSVDFADPVKKQQIQGEALFIRGLSYFNLVRMFGKVPLVTEVLTQADARQLVRDPVDDIYALILTDLDDASDLLPASYSGNSIGRATRWAALTLLGKVYMTLNRFDDALVPLGEVIDDGPYQLLTDYAAIFDPANANHAESIFEIQYEGGNLGEGSAWSFQAHNRNIASAMGISSAAATLPTASIISALGNKTSARYLASIGEIKVGTTTYRHVKKHYMEHTVQNQSDDNWPLLRYADVLLMYAEASNETTATPDAEVVEMVNKIRRRAFALPIDTPNATYDLPAVQTSTQAAFRNAVWEERRVELAFEGHRWFDLVRTGQFISVMNQHAVEANYSFRVDAHNAIYPVPQREIDINPKLRPNNPGY